jgi:hypothetical protein
LATFLFIYFSVEIGTNHLLICWFLETFCFL